MRLAKMLREPFSEYPQTWYYMPRWKPLRRFLQALHGLWGHTPSKTEWGYGGGERVDTWCRWCDKMTEIPMSEARFRFPQLADHKPMILQIKQATGVRCTAHGACLTPNDCLMRGECLHPDETSTTEAVDDAP